MYLERVGDHGEPVHANDSIHVSLGLRDVNAVEDHAIQGHDARVDHDRAGGVDNGQIVAQVAPGDMGQGVVVVAGGQVYGGIVSKAPGSRSGISREDSESSQPSITLDSIEEQPTPTDSG